MSGWNLKAGKLVSENVSEDEYWSLFNYVFSDTCKKTNTYKFGLIKSICDQIYDLRDDGNGYYFISYDKIFTKFAENYWNLVNKYNLRQMTFNGKSEYSKVEIILKEAIGLAGIPEEISFSVLEEAKKAQIVSQVRNECKRCVIGALYSDFEGKLYYFDLRGDGIYLCRSAYGFISKYKLEIEKLNYYSWARFLEKVNDDDALVRVLEKLDLSTPKRKDLSMYREILYKEFQEDKCFYCGEKLGKTIHVDHFIPWSFIKTDNIWNFVLSCPKCNLKKSGQLVKVDYVYKLNNYNQKRIENGDSLLVQNEYQAYRADMLDRIWMYAKMSGIRLSDRIM